MNYAEYAATVPTAVQVLISIALAAGISVLLVRLLHRQIIAIAQKDDDDDETTPKVPPSYYLSGRIMQVTSIAFVFLFTFTAAQFVINTRNADEATQSEAQYWSRAMMQAHSVPAAQGGDDLVAALARYRTVVVDEEWPLMARADQWGAYEKQQEVSTLVSGAAQQAQGLGAGDLPGWGSLTSSIDDMLTSGSDRLAYVPSANAESLTLAVLALGVVSLAVTAVFQPTRRGINLVLIGIMGAVYGFMFYIVVELSNPYQGSSAIESLLKVMQ